MERANLRTKTAMYAFLRLRDIWLEKSVVVSFSRYYIARASLGANQASKAILYLQFLYILLHNLPNSNSLIDPIVSVVA